VDQVTIEPNGVWKLPEPASDSKSRRDPSREYHADGEDFVISEVNVIGGRSHPDFATPSRSVQSFGSHSAGTPGTTVSWESLAMTRGTTSSKRPIAQVIDLTLSSDEDDEPIARPTKRQAFAPNGSSPFGNSLNI